MTNMFSKEQREQMEQQTREILEQVRQGEDARDIMARLYVDRLEDKTLMQGEAMADVMLNAIAQFDRDFAAAQEDLDGFIERFQEKMDEGKSCAQRCTYWLQMAASLSAAAARSGEDAEKLSAEIDAMSVSEEKATPQLEEQLREKAAGAIRNAGALFSGILGQERAETADDAEILVDLGGKDFEYRGVLSMLAYTMVKNGELEEVPVDATAEQIAAAVCVQTEEARVLREVSEGKKDVETAHRILMALGILALLALFIVLAVNLFPTLAAATGGVLVNSFGASLAFVKNLLPTIQLLYSSLFAYVFVEVFNYWIKASEGIAGRITAKLHAVRDGRKKVERYEAETVQPQVQQEAEETLEEMEKLAEEEGPVITETGVVLES